MKFLVLGSDGMVGHVVFIYLKERGHDVVGYSNQLLNTVFYGSGEGNIKSFVSEIKYSNYDAIINCMAVINQMAERYKAKASYINTFLPHFLEEITKNKNTIIVHRSTDCIFSGKRGHYDLEDNPDAESFYARTKALGEIINDKDITIRTSLIGPEQEKSGGGLFNWFFNQTNMNGFINVRWTGITTIEFAREIEILVKNYASGLFQCVPSYSVSKYDLLCLFEKYFPNDRKIYQEESIVVDKSLVQRIGNYGITVPDYDLMIEEMYEWIKKHKTVYKNYIRQ